MAVFLVKSTDSGAPTLSGTNGDFCTVSDYVLNTIAGLTIQDTASNQRNYVMGNGDILHVVHDSGTTGDARLAIVRAAESASGISSLTDPYPLTSQVADSSCNYVVSSTANSTTRAWWAIVDNSATTGCYYFFSEYSSAGHVSPIFWCGGTGIGCSALPTDNYAAAMTTKANTSAINPTLSFLAPIGSTASGRCFIKRSRDGAIKSTYSTAMPYYGVNNFGSASNGPSAPHPDGSKYRFEPVWLTDFYSQSTTVGSATELRRMWMPRLFTPMHAASSYAGFSNGDVFADSAYDASAKFAMFKFTSTAGSGGAVFVQYDGTWHKPSY